MMFVELNKDLFGRSFILENREWCLVLKEKYVTIYFCLCEKQQLALNFQV